jgi:hypothetical protein
MFLGGALDLPHLTFEEFEAEWYLHRDSRHKAAGYPFSETFATKGALLEVVPLRAWYDWIVSGGFVGCYSYEKDCGKSELREVEDGLVKKARRFIPKAAHAYFIGIFLFSRFMRTLSTYNTMLTGNSFIGRGWDKLYRGLIARCAALDLPPIFCCSDLCGNDKSQRPFLRHIFARLFRCASPIVREALRWYLAQLDEGLVIRSDGYVYRRKVGMPSGDFVTLDFNTIYMLLLMFYMLLLMGVQPHQCIVWPMALLGDDSLICWPFEKSLYELWMEEVFPMTAQKLTNENPGGGNTVPLSQSQILSFSFVKFEGSYYPKTIRPNKCLKRLNYRTNKESRIDLLRGFIVLHYFHEKLLATLEKLWLAEGYGAEELASWKMKAYTLHTNFESGSDFDMNDFVAKVCFDDWSEVDLKSNVQSDNHNYQDFSEAQQACQDAGQNHRPQKDEQTATGSLQSSSPSSGVESVFRSG